MIKNNGIILSWIRLRIFCLAEEYIESYKGSAPFASMEFLRYLKTIYDPMHTIHLESSVLKKATSVLISYEGETGFLNTVYCVQIFIYR